MSERILPHTTTVRDSVVTITGGTGSFGSTMAIDLLRRGVGAINILSRDEAKQDTMRRRIDDSRVRYFIGDVRDAERMKQAMRGIDVVIHAAAHMLADGDLAGGLRNLWDIHCLCMEFSDAQADFFLSLAEQASSYNLSGPVMRALRLTNQIFGTPLVAYNSPARISYNEHWTDQLFRRRILSCDIWGRDRHKLTGLGFYLRSHLLRMPPKMLARHLFTKWRKGHRPI